jgi:hypothetical protein
MCNYCPSWSCSKLRSLYRSLSPKGKVGGKFFQDEKFFPSDTWLWYNDARVNVISEEEVEEVEGYIYFYERREGNLDFRKFFLENFESNK